MDCSHKGNPDFYGLGIRVGIYLQLITAILARYLRPSAVPENLSANAIFLLALFVAVAIATLSTELRPEEVIIILQLCFGFIFSVLSLLGSQVSLDRLWLSKNGALHPSMASFTRLTLTTAVCVYAVWFWYHGRSSLNPSSCPANIFFFTKASIYGGVATFFKIHSTLLLIAIGGFFVWQSVELLQLLIALTCSKVTRELNMNISQGDPDNERDEKTGSSSSSEGVLEKLIASCYGIGRLRYFIRLEIPRMLSWSSRSNGPISSTATEILPDSVDMESNTNGKKSDERQDLHGSLYVWRQML
ncbi:MAG: hypothetical protein Q9184_006967 [Pyrenodesmia sp. 2 TL-2023]